MDDAKEGHCWMSLTHSIAVISLGATWWCYSSSMWLWNLKARFWGDNHHSLSKQQHDWKCLNSHEFEMSNFLLITSVCRVAKNVKLTKICVFFDYVYYWYWVILMTLKTKFSKSNDVYETLTKQCQRHFYWYITQRMGSHMSKTNDHQRTVLKTIKSTSTFEDWMTFKGGDKCFY